MHPYKSLPPSAFWSKTHTINFDPRKLVQAGIFQIDKEDKVVTAGSCFAANLVPFLAQAGLNYVRTEYVQSIYDEVPQEYLSYAKFSAGYGNIYTARQLLQLLLRCQGKFTPEEYVWQMVDLFIDPYRPGLRYVARSIKEFDILTRQHLDATRSAFESCDVFIFTLGLTEGWCSKIDGAVFPACPGTVAGEFVPERHEFHNYDINEVTTDLLSAIDELRILSPNARVILTVSPVPLVATASDNHVLVATTYSKSTLRVAADTATRSRDRVYYFPSYEIITGSHKKEDFFEDDRRSVNEAGIAQVMTAFFYACGLTNDVNEGDVREVRSTTENSTNSKGGFVRKLDAAARLAELIEEAECEEVMAEKT